MLTPWELVFSLLYVFLESKDLSKRMGLHWVPTFLSEFRIHMKYHNYQDAAKETLQSDLRHNKKFLCDYLVPSYFLTQRGTREAFSAFSSITPDFLNGWFSRKYALRFVVPMIPWKGFA